jgi:hypothetical protein
MSRIRCLNWVNLLMTLVDTLIYTCLHATGSVLQGLILNLTLVVIIDLVNALSIVFILNIRRNALVIRL